MRLEDAQSIAAKYLALFEPHCQRIAIAGSVLRCVPHVGDVEFVCIPKQEPVDLFGDEAQAAAGFCAVVNSLKKIKGQPTGKYTQRLTPEGIHLDIFMATPDNWGLILAIRTGSAGFSKRLANAWVAKGYHSRDGKYLEHVRSLDKVYIREEQELFDFLGMPFVEPEDRHY